MELTANISYEIKDPYGAVMSEDMRKKFDLMKQLNYNCKLANQIKGKKIEFSEHLISWVKRELGNKYINRIEAEIKRDNSENIFYNIIYCIISRWEFWFQCNSKKRIISKDKFCELIGKNRKTLSRQCTIYYTDQRLSKIWASGDPYDANSGIRNLISSIAETIKDKIL